MASISPMIVELTDSVGTISFCERAYNYRPTDLFCGSRSSEFGPNARLRNLRKLLVKMLECVRELFHVARSEEKITSRKCAVRERFRNSFLRVPAPTLGLLGYQHRDGTNYCIFGSRQGELRQHHRFPSLPPHNQRNSFKDEKGPKSFEKGFWESGYAR